MLEPAMNPTVALVADAGETLAALTEALPEGDGRGVKRAREARDADEARIEELRTGDDPPITSPTALRAVRSALSKETGGRGGCRRVPNLGAGVVPHLRAALVRQSGIVGNNGNRTPLGYRCESRES